ncbi:hypothetical protein [Marinobacter nauticus]|uniref:Uncharacterized protein n=1 Tax=Marinobacter nauticus TaxID=2743 RepID=A0A368UUB6_MARNT|nr:hypothetical protein [Marinobacter nauticus]RBP71119.1 hypothetical protein DET64_109249 [Marinobacter nauticus]RCW32419.1 hypothetical protein DET51_109249 [Marinobacter nauticus]
MTLIELNDSLIYLDREYISSFFEAITGASPETRITRTEGLNTGVKVPLLSAGASSAESKSYSISTLKMLFEVLQQLDKIEEFEHESHQIGSRSSVCWVEGMLTIGGVRVKRRTHHFKFGSDGSPPPESKEEFVAEEKFFLVKSGESKFALITSPDYFASGLDAFPELQGSVVDQVNIPVRALLRVFPAKSAFEEWVSSPLVILERDC